MAVCLASGAAAIFWLILILGVAVAGFMLILWLRSRLIGGSDVGRASWTLRDLERMLGTGQITESEFKALRRQIINGVGTGQADQQEGK